MKEADCVIGALKMSGLIIGAKTITKRLGRFGVLHLRPLPDHKPVCCMGSSIKPPFYETASAIAKKGHQHPKISAINPFRKSKFVNSQ